MSFNTLSDLRKQRGNFDNLIKEVEKISNPKSNFKKGDDRERQGEDRESFGWPTAPHVM